MALGKQFKWDKMNADVGNHICNPLYMEQATCGTI